MPSIEEHIVNNVSNVSVHTSFSVILIIVEHYQLEQERDMRQVIGLIGGGFKPFTAGHYSLVEKAARECDSVLLFVSIRDRARPGEVEITWEQMKQVWLTFLYKALPKNVKVLYVPSPVRGILDVLIEANTDKTNENTYMIYTDPEDGVSNYPETVQKKYMPRLVANHQIVIKPIARAAATGGVNISGTKMRQHLGTGNVKAFTKGLPLPVQLYGPKIFQLLGGKTSKSDQ